MPLINRGRQYSHLLLCPTGRVALLATLLLLLLALASCGSASTPGADTEQVELGKQLYQQNCAVCHGSRGEGSPDWRSRGPDGRYPPPPHDNTGHTWHHSDGLIFRIVKDGGDSLDIPNFKSGMPAFGDKLEDEEIKAVIAYLRTFWGDEEREFQAAASEQDPFPASSGAP